MLNTISTVNFIRHNQGYLKSFLDNDEIYPVISVSFKCLFFLVKHTMGLVFGIYGNGKFIMALQRDI